MLQRRLRKSEAQECQPECSLQWRLQQSHHQRRKRVFPVNSYVLYRPPDNSRLKMQMPKAGPYIVVSVLGDKYSIQNLLTHKVVDTYASNLSEFR
jgi:hypothetical protein